MKDELRKKESENETKAPNEKRSNVLWSTSV